MTLAHPTSPRVVTVAILVVTREPRDEEPAVSYLDARLVALGHRVLRRLALAPSLEVVQTQLEAWVQEESIDVVVVLGGVGLGPLDVVPEAVRAIADREVPGFGEAVRAALARRIGLRAYQSRALGVVAGKSLLFAIELALEAVRLAWEAALEPMLDPRSDASLVPLLDELASD